MIGDPELKISKMYDMLPATAGDSCAGRTPVDDQTVRNVYVIGPDKKVKLLLVCDGATCDGASEGARVQRPTRKTDAARTVS